MTVVTRFAPSPTGFLHIGGARTALFNYLFAKRHDGKFLLRIEDTDRKRSTQEAVDAILDGMNWLGLDADEPPIFQFERAARHREVAEAMVARGKAFRCYVTPEELQSRRERGEELRQAARADALTEDKQSALLSKAHELLKPYRSPFRNGDLEPPTESDYTIRLRAPDTGQITISDQVQGDISIDTDEIDDLILLRADGTPTYMLAVVVDDHDMGVTHVIRGDDHLRNAFRQTPIYEAMGWQVPIWAHVPMIHGDDGAKLSKRHGALGVEAYRDMGYLPEGLCNYLLRLGWSHGDRELFTIPEAAQVFNLDNVNKSPARIDFAKLADINSHHIRACPDDRLYDLLEPFLENSGNLSTPQQDRIKMAIPEMKTRGNTLVDLASAFDFLLAERPLSLNKKARKSLNEEGLDRLALLSDVLRKVTEWSPENVKLTITGLCDTRDLKMGEIGPPLRAALIGNLPAPDLHLVAAWLGKEETLARIEDQVVVKNSEKESIKG